MFSKNYNFVVLLQYKQHMNELKIKDIMEQISIEAKLIFAQSKSIVLNGNDGLSGNNYNAGSLVEGFVKNILKRYLPDRFNVVSGYIIDSTRMDSTESLKQIDCIIVEKSYPIFYKFKDIDIYIVTKESVCGIIEIKRNLNNALGSAVNQIQDIIQSTGISKTNTEIITTYGFVKTAYTEEDPKFREYNHYHNPIVGIMSLESGYDSVEGFKKHIDKLGPIRETLDFIYSFDGLLIHTIKVIEGKKLTFPEVIKFGSEDSEWAFLFHDSLNRDEKSNITKEEILWRTLGFINAFLFVLSNAEKSLPLDYWEKYYFSENMFRK